MDPISSWAMRSRPSISWARSSASAWTCVCALSRSESLATRYDATPSTAIGATRSRRATTIRGRSRPRHGLCLPCSMSVVSRPVCPVSTFVPHRCRTKRSSSCTDHHPDDDTNGESVSRSVMAGTDVTGSVPPVTLSRRRPRTTTRCRSGRRRRRSPRRRSRSMRSPAGPRAQRPHSGPTRHADPA